MVGHPAELRRSARATARDGTHRPFVGVIVVAIVARRRALERDLAVLRNDMDRREHRDRIEPQIAPSDAAVARGFYFVGLPHRPALHAFRGRGVPAVKRRRSWCRTGTHLEAASLLAVTRSGSPSTSCQSARWTPPRDAGPRPEFRDRRRGWPSRRALLAVTCLVPAHGVDADVALARRCGSGCVPRKDPRGLVIATLLRGLAALFTPWASIPRGGG
jgi:hypothetical protein